MDTTRTYYFVGIGGIGMSALAQLLSERGHRVLGSDRDASPTTELLMQKGIEVIIGQCRENVPEDIDVLIYSDAVAEDHDERIAARARGIPEFSYFKMLGDISSQFTTVAVAGTHGKTTTTGMLATILKDAEASPTAIVGSIVEDFGSNYLKGSSDLLVVEACEYRDHLLELYPRVLVLTNLEWDHTDYFPTLEALQETFQKTIERVPEDGYIIADPNLPTLQPLFEHAHATVVDYTQEPSYALRLPGDFNKDNARAAAAAARVLAPMLSTERIAHSLAEFRGTWRRFEYKGKMPGGNDVYDDYAHHPTAVAETLRALKSIAPQSGRVIVAFHPHLYSRTRDLLDGFSKAFADADEVVIAPIYPAREIDDGSVSSELLAQRIRDEGTSARAVASMDDVVPMLEGLIKPYDVVMLMGAGDIYKLAPELLGTKQEDV